MWQSPDPILYEYINGKTNGGVFNPKNLSLFTYTYNNPVIFIDPNGLETVLIFTTEPNPERDKSDAWKKPAEYAKKEALANCKSCTNDDVKMLNVNRVSEIQDALESNNDIESVYIIGHANSELLAVGNDDAPGTNISTRGKKNDVHPKKLSWKNLTDTAKIKLYGCNTARGKDSIAESIAEVSGKPTTGSENFLNFEDDGKPFVRWWRNGDLKTFDPATKEKTKK